MSRYFTTLGSDGNHYCFCISHEDDGDYLELHKRSREGTSTFNEKSFVTRIPIERILKIYLEKACKYLAPINYTHPHLIDLEDFKNYMQNEM